MEPVRLAVVGAGLIGSKHARLVSAHQSSSLVGVCDLDSRLRSVAEQFDAPFYEDLESLLTEQKPEGAIVATPNGTHSTVAEICARNAVDLLIEKPIANTLAEARQIVQSAAQAGCQVLVGHHRRYNAQVQEVRNAVQDGTLGRLIAVSIMWTLLKPTDWYRLDWRRRRPSGGPVLVNLIHELDLLRFVCGEIRQVYAQAASSARGLEVEDSLSITLSFASGALGSVVASDATPSPWSYELTSGENSYYFHANENSHFFFGSRASLAFPKMELWHYADPRRAGWQHPLVKSRRSVPKADPLVRQLEHFCRVVRREEAPLVDGPDGTRSLAAALAVLESSERNAPVDLT